MNPALKYKEHYDVYNHFELLNNDKRHFNNTNDICTPIDCVKEMVDTLPDEFWQEENLKILDPCCGNGNFHSYILQKTNLKNLYFNEINETRIKHLIDFFGEYINLTKKDFLQYEEDEKYDLVVANPPYAKFDDNNKRVSKNHNLSRDFILKALKITKENGFLLFIVPNNWMSYSDRNKLPQILSQYQFLHLNIHGAKKYFPKVGSSFTWFLLQKKENKKEFIIENHYVNKTIEKAKLNKNINFIPLYYSDIVKKILEKTIYLKCEKYKIETNSFLHRYTKKELISETKTDEYKYKLIHTPTQTLWSKKAHKYQDGYKVFFSLSNQYKIFIDNCGMTQSVAYIRCENEKKAKEIKNELDNEIFVFLNNITRYGNFNNIRVLQQLPLLEFIKLDENELKFVEEFNNLYYNNKKKWQKRKIEIF